MVTGKIVSKVQNNPLDFIVDGIVDGKCVGYREPFSSAAVFLILLEVHFHFQRDLTQVL